MHDKRNYSSSLSTLIRASHSEMYLARGPRYDDDQGERWGERYASVGNSPAVSEAILEPSTTLDCSRPRWWTRQPHPLRLPMLRAVGSHHAKQALLVPGKRHKRVHPPVHCLHSSCSLSALQALALSTDPTRHSTPLAHAYQLPPPDAAPPLPAGLRHPRPCVPLGPRGQFPSGVLDTVDAFASGTKAELTSILSDINASLELRRYLRQRESARRLAQFLASTSRPARAHTAMTLAHALGCCFKPNHFESVVYQLSQKEHWSSIPPLVSLARHQCGKITARLLNWKIRAFIECHRFARLDHVLEEFAQDSVLPTRRTFHLLVSGHLRNQDLDSAKKYLQLMARAGFPVDASTHALIVTAYRSLGLDPQVHAQAFEALHHVNTHTSIRILNSILQHFLDIGNESSATEHMNRMIVPTTSRRGVIQQPGIATGRVDGVVCSPIDTFTLPSGGASMIRPDAATFTIWINYLNSGRQFHRIHNVLNRMVEVGVQPDAGVVAALIRTYCLSGRDDTAVSLLAAMLRPGTDVQSLLTLLHLKGTSQLPINVEGIPLSVHVFNAALPRIMELRGLTGAIFIFRIMRSNGIQPNAATIELLLNYLERVEHLDTYRLTHVLRSIARKIHGPTIRHLNIILRNALRREKHRAHGCGWDTTAAKFSSTRHYKPTTPENCDILDSNYFDPSSNKDHSHRGSCVQSTISTLSGKGVKNDRATFALWLKHEGITDPTLETAKSVYRHMINKGIHPNRYHFTCLMDGFARVGDMQAAEQIMRSAKAAGFESDVVMWTVLISGYGRKGEPKLATRTFRTMIAAGISPDVAAIDALAHAYFAVGAYAAARRVLLELWPRVKPFPAELKNAPLRQLAKMFRQPQDPASARGESLTPQGRRAFNRKLCQVLQEWEQEDIA